MDIVAYDELNNSVPTLIALVLNCEWLNFKTQYNIIDPQKKNQVEVKYTLRSKPQRNPTAKLYLYDLSSSFRVSSNLTIVYKNCNPGFVLNGDTCTCDSNNTGVIG